MSNILRTMNKQIIMIALTGESLSPDDIANRIELTKRETYLLLCELENENKIEKRGKVYMLKKKAKEEIIKDNIQKESQDVLDNSLLSNLSEDKGILFGKKTRTNVVVPEELYKIYKNMVFSGKIADDKAAPDFSNYVNISLFLLLKIINSSPENKELITKLLFELREQTRKRQGRTISYD